MFSIRGDKSNTTQTDRESSNTWRFQNTMRDAESAHCITSETGWLVEAGCCQEERERERERKEWDETWGQLHFWQFPPAFWRCVRAANQAAAAVCVTLRGGGGGGGGGVCAYNKAGDCALLTADKRGTREESSPREDIFFSKKKKKKKPPSVLLNIWFLFSLTTRLWFERLSHFLDLNFFRHSSNFSAMFPDANKGWVHLNMLYFQIFPFLSPFLPAMPMNTWAPSSWAGRDSVS